MHFCIVKTISFYFTPGTDNSEFSMYEVLYYLLLYIYTQIHEGNA